MNGDEVIIKNLAVQCVIGAKERERGINQPLLLTLRLKTNFSLAAVSDNVTDLGVDYAQVSKKIHQFVVNKQAFLLEHLGESLIRYLFSETPQITYIHLEIAKPTAIPLADFAAVSIQRNRTDYPSLAPLVTPESLEDIYIGIGTNIGQRQQNISQAITRMSAFASIQKLSFLYSTPPKYVTNQPKFLNCVCKIRTDLQPAELLVRLKGIEKAMGREKGIRNGPRIIDLDILLYGERKVLVSTLVIPHPQMQEREFVMVPLMDVAPPFLMHPTLGKTLSQIVESIDTEGVIPVWTTTLRGSEVIVPYHSGSKTILMGILNVTPDSFSDGGKFSADQMGEILKAVEVMISTSTTAGTPIQILDIGGQSSRPGAAPVPYEVEYDRTIPVIKALRAQKWFDNANVLISIDTSKPQIAREAIQHGANIINDVTAGSDPLMYSVAVETRAPLILMHSRGTPLTMMGLKQYQAEDSNSIEDLICVVGQELSPKIDQALAKGVYPWQIISDVGIGFAKNKDQNLSIIRNLSKWKKAVGNFPLMVGPSRKGFLGTLINEPEPCKRVMSSAAAVSASIMNGAHIVRVHDVKEMAQLITVLNAVQQKEDSILFDPPSDPGSTSHI